MSTRHLLNIGMGTVALLLAASVGVVYMSLGGKGNDDVRIDLAMSQQALVQDLSQQVKNLNAAENLMKVNQTRQELGSTILRIDQSLNALLHGGTITDNEGTEIQIPAPTSSAVKEDLSLAAELWIQTGMPLADLAAGDFSIFSSAGQSAVAGLHDNGAQLIEQFGKAASGIRAEAQARYTKGNLARWFALGFAGLFIGLGISRFKQTAIPAKKVKASPTMAPAAPAAPVSKEQPEPQPEPNAPQVWNSQPHQRFTSPVDFDNVNASVDQLSVDMNTIAGSTQKMQVAIDSVGHAMQGMLFSLNQMAQDTAEGYKIVRGANNAATYTHNTAGELAESALEMSRVVGRVTQLAMKTKQIAGQIEAEAVSTGSTGEAFTSVVAAEVKGLAQQTSQATAGIEQTVAEILGTARQYEEAIGQIIKNISAINKVSENLGELMLHPPAAGVAGTPLPAAAPMQLAPQPVATAPAPVAQAPVAPVPAPAPEAEAEAATPPPAPVSAPEPVAQAAAEPEAPAPAADDTWGAVADDPVVTEPTAEKVAEETTAAIEETAAESEPSGSAGNVFMLGGPKKAKPKPKAKDPAAEKPAEVAPPKAEEKKEDDGGNIFMLNKPKADAPAKAAEEAPAPEAKIEEPAAPEKEDDGGNIFMLNKPKGDTPAKAETPPPAAEPEAEKPEPAKADDSGDGNVFMLNKPKKAAPVEEEAPPAAEPKAEEPAAAEEEDSGTNIFMLKKPVKSTAPKAEKPAAKEKEAVTVPADAEEEKEDDGGSNIFMLNKPK